MPKHEHHRVLVVDDEPDLRELLSDALSIEDVEVLTAASGAEAIDVARRCPPDMLITDIGLGDCSGLDVIDQLRATQAEIPAVIITGQSNSRLITEATQHRPVEVMLKPLDVGRLAETVREELSRSTHYARLHQRARRLRSLARTINTQRKDAEHRLDTTCADLTTAYRTLSTQLTLHQTVMAYQNELLAARSDDDVFRSLFRTIVQRSGPVFGVAMVCDADAELQIIGRFGVPPDGSPFCQAPTKPVISAVLTEPQCLLMDAGEETELFDESIRKFLPGLSVLAVPLMPEPGEMIGLLVLYRKGEQPFVDTDVALAELIAPPTAVAVRRND